MARSSRDKEIYPITLRKLDVAKVEDVSPAMRRVTLTGEQLAENHAFGVYAPPLISDGFDDDIRMIFPDPNTGERPHPQPHEDGSLEWIDEVRDLFRTYTVRAFDPDNGTLTIDFARHGQGLAEDWSAQTAPGDYVYIAGPKSCAVLPTHTDWLLLAGDETALPAIGRAVEALPEDHRAIVVVEVPSKADIQDLSHGPNVDLRWIVRDDGGDFVEDVVDLFSEEKQGAAWKLLSDGVPYIWAAGEATRLKTIRRLVKTLNIPREHVEITGYWRKALAPATPVEESAAADAQVQDAADHADGAATDNSSAGAPSGQSVIMELHEMAELAPAFAVRAATEMDLFGYIDVGHDSVDALAGKLGKNPDSLQRFLRYLESLKLLILAEGRIQLTPLGSELADPDSMIAGSFTGPAHVKTMALAQIADVLSTDNPADLQGERSVWQQAIAKQPQLAGTAHDATVYSAGWTAPAVAQCASEILPADSVVAIGGAGASVYADEVLRKMPQATAIVLGELSEVEDQAIGQADNTDAASALLREVNAARRNRVEYRPLHQGAQSALEDATAAIIIDPWEKLGTSEVAAEDMPVTDLLKRAVAGCQTFLVTAVLSESGGDDHDYEEDITRLAVHGTSVPTQREIGRVLAAADAIITDQRPVGWSKQMLSLADPSC